MPKCYFLPFLTLLAILLSWPDSHAQTSRLYTTVEGLPSSHISHVFFDADDFLWVSTELGLSRFNGERFTNFQADSASPYCMSDDQINSLYIDRDGQYWVAGSGGLYSFDHAHNCFTRHALSPNRQDISVSSIVDHPRRAHTLIVSTYGWGLRVFDAGQSCVDTVATAELQSLVGTSPTRLHVDAKGRLWCFQPHEIDVIDLVLADRRAQHLSMRYPELATEGYDIRMCAEDSHNQTLYLATSRHGVLRVDLTTLTMQPLPLEADDITALAVGPNDELYIGTETRGLWIYNPVMEEVREYRSSDLRRYNHAKIHSIAFDRHQNLWLGLYQRGVLVLSHRENCIFTLQPVSFIPDGPNLGTVTGFASLPDGGRAFAIDAEGVVVDYADGQHQHYSNRNSILATNAVLALSALPDGTIMVGTYLKGVYLIGPDRQVRRDARLSALDKASITDFQPDPIARCMYIATNGQGLFRLDYQTGELTSPVPDEYGIKWINNLFLCSKRQLWISRADHLSRLDLRTGEVKAPRQSRSRVLINGFAETSDGRLWMASNKGLLRYDPQADSLMLVSDGTPMRRHYSALMNSRDGRLWMASAGCVTMYDTLQHRFVDLSDPNISGIGTVNPHSSKAWPDGTFSFGGDNGVLTFSPENVHSFRQISQRLLFTSLRVDNTLTDYDPARGSQNVLDRALWCADCLTLPASSSSFALTFCLLDPSGESGISYSYRLVGHDDDGWHPCHDGNQLASFRSLPSGHYTFEVRAKDENDARDDSYIIRQLHVHVLSPWYATWWAVLLWLLLLSAVIWGLVSQILARRRSRHELRAAETQRQVKEGKLHLLTSVSHEIKTPLTLIISPLRKMMSRKTDPATQSVLEMMYRNSLRILMLVNQQLDVRRLDSGELLLHVSELPLRSFLDDLMQYFSSVALSRHLTYSLTLPEGHDDMTLWADATQLDKVVMNLLSNAIKYVPDGGRVLVEVSLPDDEHTCISIFNSGSQLPAEQQQQAFSGIGLSIAREITGLHHGQLRVRNLEDGVAFDIVLHNGKDVFTEQELQTVETAAEPAVLPSWLPSSSQASALDGERLEVVASTTLDEENHDRQLVAELSDELRAKKRLRERRASLDPVSELPAPGQLSQADEKLMRRVIDLIHKNLSDSEFSVETLSAELGISRVHLNRKLKELLDISPSVLIKSVRLKQAALLLIQSNVTVAEVAYSVGFSSPAYFTTNFTQYYGMTPKDFTNAYIENPDSPELRELLG